jgi:hypothetical protein
MKNLFISITVLLAIGLMPSNADRIIDYCMKDEPTNFVVCIENQKKYNAQVTALMALHNRLNKDDYALMKKCSQGSGTYIREYICAEEALIELFNKK